MATLTPKAQELLSFLRNEYIDNGYLYSGSWPYESLRAKGFAKEAMQELVSANLITRRNCDGFAYELSVDERSRLINEHALCSKWFEKAGQPLLHSIQQEVRNATGLTSGKNELISVYTIHAEGTKTPKMAEVRSPFAVGDVIQLEYDLPKKRTYTGYSLTSTRHGKAEGSFMVSDILCNMLVSPPMNMIALQSLSQEFNELYPNDRNMLIFEDVVLRRVREPSSELSITKTDMDSMANHAAARVTREAKKAFASLDAQISFATAKTENQSDTRNNQEKELEK